MREISVKCISEAVEKLCIKANKILPSDLAENIGMPYTVKSVFVNLYINGDYKGLYQLCEKVEIAVKYEGYISRQQAQVDEMLRLENKPIPADIDYDAIKGLRLEAIEKLKKILPSNIGQASRISGVSPADVSVLLIYLSK